ncbi:hypothetical protein A8C75_07110 [Marinobacterium aestuarii]|uniref:Uncharacterized protein n=1 Tax=Marinobacterium aestuarii TaxID=1821621 RepID=A0A1A9EXN3_9GAMM|nr:hypothetical protein [Marinobacterium aestuarii]ANG62283.1 hypothetical protein A8C75_07110 [Marinobacterium aestuarii]
MKSYLFSTENGRGGVILCDIDAFDDAVVYLRQRFDGVVRVEQGLTLWTLDEGFGQFEPVIVPNLPITASREPPPG